MNTTTMQMPAELRPYEKAHKYGVSSLTDAELLAIILRCGTKEKNSVALSGELLDMMANDNGLAGLMKVRESELCSIAGIGRVKALELLSVGEISKRIARQAAARQLRFDAPETIADYYMEQLRHSEKEQVILVLLDNKMGVISELVLSVGTVNASLVSTREIFLEACRYRAVYIVLVHNHPSGDATPSRNDIEITAKVQEAGELLDIHLLDHIIIGDCQFTSFRENMICNERSR